jgi:hypothetical protein
MSIIISDIILYPGNHTYEIIQISFPDELFGGEATSTAHINYGIILGNLPPCVAQPGIERTSAQKPPSSASRTTILKFHIISM